MRLKCALLMAGVLALGLTVQAQAAPKGFTDHKTSGLTVALPNTWQIAPKEALAQLQQQAGPMKILLAAQGEANGMPKFTVIEQPGDGMSQAEYTKLDEAGIANICKTVNENTKGRMPNIEDFACSREKAAKGSALTSTFTIPAGTDRPALTSVTWAFYNAKKMVMVSAMFPKADSAKILPQLTTALKSIQLGK